MKIMAFQLLPDYVAHCRSRHSRDTGDICWWVYQCVCACVRVCVCAVVGGFFRLLSQRMYLNAPMRPGLANLNIFLPATRAPRSIPL